MKLEQAKTEKEKLLTSLKNAKSNDELDKIELELRKLNYEMNAQTLPPEARPISEGVPMGELRAMKRFKIKKDIPVGESKNFNFNEAITEKTEKDSNSNTKKNTRNDTIGIALRNGQKWINQVKIPEQQRNLDLGKYIKGVVTGQWNNAEAERRALDSTATGVLIPSVLSASIIDLARNTSLFTLANVPVVPMKEGNVTIARIKKDPSFKFKQELAAAEENDFELDKVELKAKTAYGYAYVSLETINSSANLNNIMSTVLMGALAQCIDNAVMYGQPSTAQGIFDDFAPSGIMNDLDIHTVTAAQNGGYDSFIRAMGKIKASNGIPTVYGINAATDEYLSLLKDSTGQYLNIPTGISEMNRIISNQLQHDDTEGNDALVFDPNALIIGLQNNISLEIISNTDYCVKHGAICFRVMAMLDAKVTQPKHICRIKGIL